MVSHLVLQRCFRMLLVAAQALPYILLPRSPNAIELLFPRILSMAVACYTSEPDLDQQLSSLHAPDMYRYRMCIHMYIYVHAYVYICI